MQVKRPAEALYKMELRRAMPGLAIRTNFIVGFPGETAADFRKLVSFVREAGFDNLGVFPYSREPGTSAAGFPEQVEERVKAERVEALVRAQSGVVDAINAKLRGKTLDLLMDSPFFGRTYRDAPEIDGRVEVEPAPGRTPKAGDFVKARILSAEGYLRRAELVP